MGDFMPPRRGAPYNHQKQAGVHRPTEGRVARKQGNFPARSSIGQSVIYLAGLWGCCGAGMGIMSCKAAKSLKGMVGAAGIEPATPPV